MLKTLLNLFSILALVCAGLVFVLCANQWFMYAQNNIQDEEPSIVKIFKNIGDVSKEIEQEKISPLVSQASEFALIIDPPKPPATIVEEKPQPRITQPVALAPRPSANQANTCDPDETGLLTIYFLESAVAFIYT